MQVAITGKQIDVGTALQEHVESDLQEAVKKYFEKAVSADVVFSKSRYLFKADILVHDGTGHASVIKASAEDADIYASYEQAADKIKKRLGRYKDRIKNHHKEALKAASFGATEYVLSGKEEHHESDEQQQSPLIIAEGRANLEHLSVSDAVMRMDLGELPAVMFINTRTGNINMVYRRLDGNIAWIDPGNAAKPMAA